MPPSLRYLLNSCTDDGLISDEGVNLDVQLIKKRLEMTKKIPLSQLVDWNLVRNQERLLFA